MRILVTGSRNWDDVLVIQKTLEDYNNFENTLVSGNCPSGADKIAEDIWRGNIERHPANWSVLGPAAGPIRNKQMVDSNPDICIAFIKNNSRGASNTVALARMAGISTSVIKVD